MLHLHTIKPRIPRLRELVAELVQDYLLMQSLESPLLDSERRAYLNAILEAIAGVDEGFVVLDRAVQPIEGAAPDERVAVLLGLPASSMVVIPSPEE